MYTPQFKHLYEEYFLPSLKDEFTVIVREYPEDCPSGMFRAEGWEKVMLNKLELLLEAIRENWNDAVFFYSDLDIIFLRPVLKTVLEHLGDKDFVAQQGWPRNTLCAGFFAMKGNEKTLKLIEEAHRLLREKICVDDQEALRRALNSCKEGEIAAGLLPSKQFPNGRRVLKKTQGHYSPGSEIILDDSVLLFHANCCIGLENKYQFLEEVQEIYSQNIAFKSVKNE